MTLVSNPVNDTQVSFSGTKMKSTEVSKTLGV